MTVASFIAAQRTDHRVPHAKCCRWLGVSQSWFYKWHEHELLSRRHFTNKDQARREVAAFIDNYNHRRRHSSCEMMPPAAYEQVLEQRAAEQARKERAA
jgi:transposase InsO family protein